jgi:hypothetical protein
MAQQTTRARAENRAGARFFSSPYALAFVRRAVASGLSQAEARRRYLDFVNRTHVQPRERRGA